MTYSGEIISQSITVPQTLDGSTVITTVNDLSYTGPLLAISGVKVFIRIMIPFTLVGAISGYKFRVFNTGAVLFSLGWLIYNDAGVLINTAYQTAPADVAGAALAGNYVLQVEGMIHMGGSNTIEIGFAQNVADADAITILSGSFLQIIPAGT
jgi:hypothetical protein